VIEDFWKGSRDGRELEEAETQLRGKIATLDQSKK
jgi:hypothetical protein